MDRHTESEPSLTLLLTRNYLPSRTVIPGTKGDEGEEENERTIHIRSSTPFSISPLLTK